MSKIYQLVHVQKSERLCQYMYDHIQAPLELRRFHFIQYIDVIFLSCNKAALIFKYYYTVWYLKSSVNYLYFLFKI